VGRSALAVENRMFLFGSVLAPLKITLSPFILASSGLPYNITTAETTWTMASSMPGRPWLAAPAKMSS